MTFQPLDAPLSCVFLPLKARSRSVVCDRPSLRMTGYLVLFWYLSWRNSCRYSDPCVWGGSFLDEVRPLTAMKQDLKQIKRHFPQPPFTLPSARPGVTERERGESEGSANVLLSHVRETQQTEEVPLNPQCRLSHVRYMNMLKHMDSYEEKHKK